MAPATTVKALRWFHYSIIWIKNKYLNIYKQTQKAWLEKTDVNSQFSNQVKYKQNFVPHNFYQFHKWTYFYMNLFCNN